MARRSEARSQDGWDDLAALARAPAWPLERILSLDGKCRGALLTRWAEHVARRFGSAEPDALRDALGVSARELPDAPVQEGWYPIAWQLGLTRLIVDRHLDGDILRLEALIREDATRDRKPETLVERLARRMLTPRRLLAASKKVYPHVYDAGGVETRVTRRQATLSWSGAEFMAEPVWRILQVFAVRGVFLGLEAPEPGLEASGGEERFTLIVDY